MKTIFRSPNLYCFFLILLCFTLTSGGWISWNYHLMEFVSPTTADLLSMGAGYGLQAAGIACYILICQKGRIRFSPLLFTCVLALYCFFLIPSVLSTFTSAVMIFGLGSNFICGIIAAVYLNVLALEIGKERRGIVFGGGYAASTLAIWILSLIGEHNLLKSAYIWIIYVLLAALSGFLVYFHRTSGHGTEKNSSPNQNSAAVSWKTVLWLGGGTVLLLSMVKNVGFSFPSADIISGVNMELSRVFYGSGLLIAGIINDKSRKFGAICTLAALIMPFMSLALSGQPIPGMVFWALDYFFYGFFSVFRVLFFADLANETNRPQQSGLGLLFGRMGDVAGTMLCILLAGNIIVLVLSASILFVLTVILFFLLYLRFYVTDKPELPTEQERFEEFSDRFRLSSREQEVLRLVLEEKSNAEIAASLYVSESTVKFHIHNILKKTACKNRSELKNIYKKSS